MLNACESARVAKEARKKAAEETARAEAARAEADRAEADRVAREARVVEEVISRCDGIDPAVLIEAARRLQAQQNDPECSVESSSFKTAPQEPQLKTPPPETSK